MCIDKQIEYASLRQEILDSITSRDNYILAMYTITTAVLCVAFEQQNPILFLIPYIVLFAFQNSITSKNENMIVLAAYIAVYLEDGNGWESDNVDLKKNMYDGDFFKRPTSIWKYLIGRIGSVQLGLLCSVSCITYCVPRIFDAVYLLEVVEPGICILLAVVLHVLIRIQTKNTLEIGHRRKKYIDNLRRAKEEKEKTYVYPNVRPFND